MPYRAHNTVLSCLTNSNKGEFDSMWRQKAFERLGSPGACAGFLLVPCDAPPSGVASGELNTLRGPLRHRPGMGFLISREGPSRVRGSRFWHNRRQKGGTSLVADLSDTDLVPSDRAFRCAILSSCI